MAILGQESEPPLPCHLFLQPFKWREGTGEEGSGGLMEAIGAIGSTKGQVSLGARRLIGELQQCHHLGGTIPGHGPGRGHVVRPES